MGKLAMFALLGLVDCGKSAEPAMYTCDLSNVVGQYECTHFGPMDANGLGYNQSFCASRGGVFGTGLSCPAAGVVASCTWPGGTEQFWYAGFADLAGVEYQCRIYGVAWKTYP